MAIHEYKNNGSTVSQISSKTPVIDGQRRGKTKAWYVNVHHVARIGDCSLSIILADDDIFSIRNDDPVLVQR